MSRVAVTDATVIINFVHLQRLDLLARIPGLRFVIPPEVIEEVTDPCQAARLQDALGQGFLAIDELTDPAGLDFYAVLRKSLGKGESACLALAASRGWALASDDREKAFRRQVLERIGKDQLLDTEGILRRAIACGALALAEADAMIPVLAAHRFRLPFGSFVDTR